MRASTSRPEVPPFGAIDSGVLSPRRALFWPAALQNKGLDAASAVLPACRLGTPELPPLFAEPVCSGSSYPTCEPLSSPQLALLQRSEFFSVFPSWSPCRFSFDHFSLFFVVSDRSFHCTAHASALLVGKNPSTRSFSAPRIRKTFFSLQNLFISSALSQCLILTRTQDL